MHDHDQGLEHDLALMLAAPRPATAMSRRQALRWLGGATLLPLIPLAACGDDNGKTTTDTGVDTGLDTGTDATDTADDTTVTSCSTIPTETAGPYPGDGSNGANVLALSGVVRRDIRTSIGALSGAAEGVVLRVRLTIVNVDASCAPLVDHAVYIWHCDRAGEYSMYTDTTQNYLRGVQATDQDGVVEFTSIFPACYAGRWPHIHFEIYPSLAKATASGNKIATSQLALPKAECDAVYATAGYEQSVTNLSQLSLASDGVFADGASLQIASMSGNVDDGYTAELVVAIAG